MQPHPHDLDVKALLRIAVVYNIPIACNRSSADFIISSHLVEEVYEPVLKDYRAYLNREIELRPRRMAVDAGAGRAARGISRTPIGILGVV